MSIKQTFLKQTDNFMDELCTIFPQNMDIQLFREKYNLARSANSNLIIDYFCLYVYPLKQKIMNQEESFFLEGGGQEELKDASGLRFRDNITKLWKSEMSDENKEIIWKYFKVFIILCEKYLLENMK